MNYEQKYKEALERARNMHEQGMSAERLEYVFPEFRESEDERIRKALIDYFDDANKVDENPLQSYGIHTDKAIAWLEKQGRQKHDNKVEPKFKIEKCKWYVCIRNLYDNYANKAFCEGDIYLSTQDGSLIPCNSNVPYKVVCPDTYFRDWTIKDAKDGDVLAAHECLVLFKEIDGLNIRCYCTYHYLNSESFYIDTLQNKTAFQPATKEQCDLLFQKMKEAGYEWNAEKKELKKIEKESNWSEEDEKLYNSALWHVKNSCGNGGKDSGEYEVYNWLKSIKDRVQPQPKQEWSEEDEKMKNLIISTLTSVGTINLERYYHMNFDEVENWLNKKMFDYRGLIPIGLGIDCTGLNIYENEKSI